MFISKVRLQSWGKCLSLQDGTYGKIYSCQVLLYYKTNMWKNKTGINTLRGSHKLKVLEVTEECTEMTTSKTPQGYGPNLGFTKQRHKIGSTAPFQLQPWIKHRVNLRITPGGRGEEKQFLSCTKISKQVFWILKKNYFKKVQNNWNFKIELNGIWMGNTVENYFITKYTNYKVNRLPFLKNVNL